MYYYFTTSLEMAIQVIAGNVPGFNVVRYGPNIPDTWDYEWKMRVAKKELKLEPRQKMNTLLARRWIYSKIDTSRLPESIVKWNKEIKEIEGKIAKFSNFMDNVLSEKTTQPVLVSGGMKYFPNLKINKKMKIVDITSLILTGELPQKEEKVVKKVEVTGDPQITALYLSIAEICHTVNREYCIFIGDESQPVWEETPDNIKKSAFSEVELFLKNPTLTPEQMHQKRVDYKQGEGWKFGEVKDVKEKLHPNLVRFAKLSEAEQFKDILFIDTIKWSFTKLQEEKPMKLEAVVKEMVEYMKLKATPPEEVVEKQTKDDKEMVDWEIVGDKLINPTIPKEFLDTVQKTKPKPKTKKKTTKK